MIERRILLYAARAVYALLVVVEATQAIKKIREAFERASK
jgi:hypothetical protein